MVLVLSLHSGARSGVHITGFSTATIRPWPVLIRSSPSGVAAVWCFSEHVSHKSMRSFGWSCSFAYDHPFVFLHSFGSEGGCSHGSNSCDWLQSGRKERESCLPEWHSLAPNMAETSYICDRCVRANADLQQHFSDLAAANPPRSTPKNSWVSSVSGAVSCLAHKRTILLAFNLWHRSRYGCEQRSSCLEWETQFCVGRVCEEKKYRGKGHSPALAMTTEQKIFDRVNGPSIVCERRFPDRAHMTASHLEPLSADTTGSGQTQKPTQHPKMTIISGCLVGNYNPIIGVPLPVAHKNNFHYVYCGKMNI